MYVISLYNMIIFCCSTNKCQLCSTAYCAKKRYIVCTLCVTSIKRNMSELVFNTLITEKSYPLHLDIIMHNSRPLFLSGLMDQCSPA